MAERSTLWAMAWVSLAIAGLSFAATTPEGPAQEAPAQGPAGLWYGGVRAGGTYLDRHPFEYGQVAPDANDAPPAATLAATRGPEHFDLNTWGPHGEVFVGRHLSERLDVELRFALAKFSEKDDYQLPVTDSGWNFFIPYLDAGRTPAPGRPLRAGIYGVRYRDRGPVAALVDYDARSNELGLDFIYTLHQAEGTCVQLVGGPALVYYTQDFDQRVSGSAIGGWATPTVVSTSEDVEELYAGVKAGARASQAVASALSLVGEADLFLLYGRAGLEADQNIAGGQTVIGVHDSERRFAPRLDLLTGLKWRPTENMALGLFYRLGVWWNAARVDNPELSLIYAEGDYRWAGSHPAHLTTDTVVTHSGFFTFALEF